MIFDWLLKARAQLTIARAIIDGIDKARRIKRERREGMVGG